MLDVRDDGLVIIRRCDYLYRGGNRDREAERRMGDGDILAQIPPSAWKDIRDAREICDYIRRRIRWDR